jgi:RNA polymerase sigma-B factor
VKSAPSETDSIVGSPPGSNLKKKLQSRLTFRNGGGYSLERISSIRRPTSGWKQVGVNVADGGVARKAAGTPQALRSRADVRRLLREYHAHGDLRARSRLIQQYLPLVKRLARRYVGQGEQLEDLVQVGSIGLIKAIDRFQVDRGVDLASYAIPTIDGEIKRHLRDRAWPIRVPRRLQERDPGLRSRVAELVDGLNGEFDRHGELEHGYELGEHRIALAAGFHVLDVRERQLLRLAYFDGLSQAQIARRVGISQIHVSRLTRRALAKLQVAMGHPDL